MQPANGSSRGQPDAGGIEADVIVAGAGVAGLSCAAALADAGLRVVVFERDGLLGGRAASWIDEATGDTVDIGPHVLTSEHRNFLALLQRLGTDGNVSWQTEPLITLLDGGRQLRMHSSGLPPPLHGLPNLRNALRCVGAADALSNWRVAWRAARLNESTTLALDGQDALSYLRQMGVTERFIEWFWASAMLALLNVPLQHCSAAALMRVFRLLLGRSGYCFGFPKTGLSDLFVPGCCNVIERAGGKVIASTPVQQVLQAEGRFHGFVLEGGREVSCRAGVLALPPPALSSLLDRSPLPALLPQARAARRCEPVPYVSTMLWFDRKLGRERFWARTNTPDGLNTDFYDLSNIRDGAPDRPSLIVCNAIDAQTASGWDDERLVNHTLNEIADFSPDAANARLRHARVHRIPLAIPAPNPGFEKSRPASDTAISGLWLAGDWMGTGIPCSMESAARSGALVAEQVMQQFGSARRIALEPPETTGFVALLRKADPRQVRLPD